ncbi:MAG: acyl-CoA thioesterase [Chloroflexi bacterium]|nr:acyl-CoA thioesterase [Chloroflexota bacterium]
MSTYRFAHPIEVRYGDLDPQGHLNNAKYLTYFEQARIQYLIHLGLFRPGQSFLEIGIILAEARVTFLKPVHFGQSVEVCVRVIRLGNKSFETEYLLRDRQTHEELARGSSVQVTYDYHTAQTIPIPPTWRQAIAEFEGLPL